MCLRNVLRFSFIVLAHVNDREQLERKSFLSLCFLFLLCLTFWQVRNATMSTLDQGRVGAGDWISLAQADRKIMRIDGSRRLPVSIHLHTHTHNKERMMHPNQVTMAHICAVFVSILHLVFWSFPSSQSLLSLSCKENKLWKPSSAAYCIVIIYEWQIHCVALLKKMCCWNAHLLWLYYIHWVCLSLLADWDCCEQECQQTDCQDTVVTLARKLSLRWWILPVNVGKL